MMTFILLVVFALLGIGFAIIAYSANQRKRAGQSGMDAVRNQRETHPRATPPDV